MEREQRPLSDLTLAVPNEPLFLAAIGASEILTGLYYAETPARRLQREAAIEAVLEAIPVVPFDLRIARVHAQLWVELGRSGMRIGANDLLIAATAIAHGLGVLTENLRDFGRVPGLEVRKPQWPKRA